MKTPLLHQATQFDCGTTTMVNALVYLFEREEIPPEVVDYIHAVTLDRNIGPQDSRWGTSGLALAFLAAWMNDYADRSGFPVRCRALSGDEVTAKGDSELVKAVQGGAVAVAGCCLGADHYVLITGIDDESVRLFDPYYDTWPLHELEGTRIEGVELVEDEPFACNRIVERRILDEPAHTAYSLEAISGRDAVLIWRSDR